MPTHTDKSKTDNEDQRFVETEAEEIRQLLGQVPWDVVVTGQRLATAKSMLKHAEWGAWLRSELAWDERTAQRLMSFSEQFKDDKWGFLSLAPSALDWLARLSAPKVTKALAPLGH